MQDKIQKEIKAIDEDTPEWLKSEASARYLLRRIFSKDCDNLGNMLYAERMKDLENTGRNSKC